jgi:hypothetical protein
MGRFSRNSNCPKALSVDRRGGISQKPVYKYGKYWQKLTRALMYACHRDDFHETHACSTTFTTDLVYRIS